MNINTFSLYDIDSIKIDFTQGADFIKIKTPDHEEGFGLIIKNTSGAPKTVKVRGGNSVLSVGDMVLTAEEGETLINLKNTGRYKNVSGEDAGYIVLEIPDAENISVFAFEL